MLNNIVRWVIDRRWLVVLATNHVSLTGPEGYRHVRGASRRDRTRRKKEEGRIKMATNKPVN